MTEQPAVTHEQLELLVEMACRAPSVHNTQPWHFVARPDGVTMLVERSRQLGVIDPDGRELLVSCGAALHHLQVAARAIGVDATVDVALDGDLVARVALHSAGPATANEVRTAVAILHRHTHRGRFDEGAIPEATMERLRAAVEFEDGMLRPIREDELVDVEVIVSRAEQTLLAQPAYRDELAAWVRDGGPMEGRGDGMPQAAVDHGPGRAESLPGRDFVPPRPRSEEPPEPENPTVVLLSSPGDTPRDWLQAGRALSALLLAATSAGLVVQPIGQVMDLPASRLALGHLLGVLGSPQMLLRLGPGTSVPTTARRRLSEVLG